MPPPAQYPAHEPTTVLLGIMSGGARRRALARCIFGRMDWPARMLSASLAPVRIVFIVGENGEHVAASSDVLHVPVKELGVVTSSFSTTGTTAVLLKLVHFFRFAATQPEQVVAFADDDTFVALPRLHAVAAELQQHHRRFYAGAFEWYNYIPSTFRATGWGSGPQQASYDGQRFANCTRDGRSESGCIGPLSFAKGYFVMLDRVLVQELVSSARVRADFERASALGIARHSIHHDVQLGLWVTTLAPELVYVSINELGLHDRRGWGRYTTLPSEPLLVAHRLPHACWSNASYATAQRRHTESSASASLSIYSPGLGERLSVVCKEDDNAFVRWTVRPPGARACAVGWSKRVPESARTAIWCAPQEFPSGGPSSDPSGAKIAVTAAQACDDERW